MARFLDEVNGGFVVYTLLDATIAGIVGKRVYPDVAPQDESESHIIYTRKAGHAIKSHQGLSGNETLTLDVYAIGTSQPVCNQLADLLVARWLAVDYTLCGDTRVQVCNGGTVQSGQWFPKDSSDEHMFFNRLVLSFLLGNV